MVIMSSSCIILLHPPHSTCTDNIARDPSINAKRIKNVTPNPISIITALEKQASLKILEGKLA